MKQLVIIGASALGREACNYARDAGFTVKGFLHDKSGLLDGFDGYPPILGSVDTYEIEEDDVFVCALGDPLAREKYVAPIADRGGTFVNIVHPTAYVGPNVVFGTGCIVCPMSVLDCDLTLGNHVIVNVQSLVAHDCVLEDFVTVSPGCHLGGRSKLKRCAFMGIQAATIPDSVVGTYSMVAAGAVATKPVPNHSLVAGVPAVFKKSL